ncbi:MAG: phage integrase N-terminal SAM-like domain-containing protein [Spirochaetales bacterium]|nr:phage integrase N-terminal SAM-like domain-containing protein [Spirochaetales bacterium]
MEELLARYKRDLALKGYSTRTCQHYYLNVLQFLSYYQQSVDEIKTEEIKDYLFYLISDKKALDSKVR